MRVGKSTKLRGKVPPPTRRFINRKKKMNKEFCRKGEINEGNYPETMFNYNVMKPISHYNIKGRWLSVYWVEGRTESAPYSVYWDDENNPIQHNMSDREVFNLLEDIINETSLLDE